MATLTLRMVLVITLAIMTECARPLQSAQMSSLVLSMLQTPPKPLQPPPLSPMQREQLFRARKPPSPTEEQHRQYRFGNPTLVSNGGGEMNQVRYGVNGRPWGFQQLHKNPAGPNPIGNEFRPGNSKTMDKKNRCPPPHGG